MIKIKISLIPIDCDGEVYLVRKNVWDIYLEGCLYLVKEGVSVGDSIDIGKHFREIAKAKGVVTEISEYYGDSLVRRFSFISIGKVKLN